MHICTYTTSHSEVPLGAESDRMRGVLLTCCQRVANVSPPTVRHPWAQRAMVAVHPLNSAEKSFEELILSSRDENSSRMHFTVSSYIYIHTHTQHTHTHTHTHTNTYIYVIRACILWCPAINVCVCVIRA